MPEQINFHRDENVSNAIAQGLRRRGINVTTTDEESLIGVSDEEHLSFSRLQQRILFTQDDDFLRLHQNNIPHAGITYCHQCKRSIGEIIQALCLIWEWLEPDDMIGQVEFI